jgi:peptidylprolyl isomerase
MARWLVLSTLLALASAGAREHATMSDVLEGSSASDWRQLDAANTLYLQLDSGRVVIELAPQFAPSHVDNIRKLVEQRYFDGLAIIRSQDNYVAQWGDPNADTDAARSIGEAAASLDPEFYREASGLPFTVIGSRDPYAQQVGFSDGFPAGRDGPTGRAWLTHCYGMLGVGRAEKPDSGNGAELYVVTGHAPRHLDRNVTLVGRVIHGTEYLTTLPRGTGPLGFYTTPAEHVPIKSLRFGTDLPAAQRLNVELLRTDTDTFGQWVQARRHRAESWFVDPTDGIGVCNVPLPVRSLEHQ